MKTVSVRYIDGSATAVDEYIDPANIEWLEKALAMTSGSAVTSYPYPCLIKVTEEEEEEMPPPNTFHVDSVGGSDSNDGTKTSKAWKTLAHAAAQSYAAGAKILLKRGRTWNEPFTYPTVDGLIVDAYGTGAKPIVYGGGNTRIILLTGGALNTVTRNLKVINGGPNETGDTGANYQVTEGNHLVEDCDFDAHASDALAANGGGGTLTMRRCTFHGAGDEAITLHNGSSGVFEDCTFSNNRTAINNAGGVNVTTCRDCVFEMNGADGAFGDIQDLAGPSTFDRCRFNGRNDGSAWAFIKDNPNPMELNYCIFNASGANGVADAVISINEDTVFRNCVFYGGGKGSFVINSGVTVTMTNCIILDWWRMAFGSGPGDWSPNPDGILNTENCIIRGVNVKATTNEVGTITADPQFVNAASGDFRLQAGSPAINAGVNVGLSLDIGKNAATNPPSIGAYE